MEPYISTVETDELISDLMLSTDPARLTWDALNDSDKQIVLNRAMSNVEAVQYSGRRLATNQLTEFPRLGQPYVPTAIKQALALEAVAVAKCSTDADYRQRESLQAQGVVSFSIGKLSESYDKNRHRSPLLSMQAQTLLRPYMLGGVRIVV